MAADILPVKTCRKCGSMDLRVSGRCRACSKIASAARYSGNKERIAAQSRARYEKNKDHIAIIGAKYRSENKEKIADRDAAYRAANPEKMIAYRAANKQRRAEVLRIWRLAHPEARRVHEHNRRAMASKNGWALSKNITEKLFSLQRGKCACCGLPLGDDYHLDHVMPLALGGENSDGNMQLLRKRCNAQKHAKHPVDFMRSRGFLL